jgi:hypothetical protein
MQSTIIVAKTEMEYPLVQVGKARGLTIGPGDTLLFLLHLLNPL